MNDLLSVWQSPLRRVAFLASLLLVVATLGCDPDETNDDTGPTGPDDVGDATDVVDTSADGGDTDLDTSTDRPDGDTGGANDHCGLAIRDLGTWSVDASGEKLGGFDAAGNGKPDCADEASEPGAAVYRFELDEAAKVGIRVFGRQDGASEPYVELHSGECDGSRNVSFCTRMDRREANLQADTPYYLWVYGSQEWTFPQFRLTWEVTAPADDACDADDFPACVDGSHAVCENNAEERFDCPSGCGDGSMCAGDTCSTAPVVDLSGGTQTVTADRYAFHSEWTASGKTDCVVGSNTEPAETPGVEFFGKIEGFSQGDTLVFDSMGPEGEDPTSRKGESNVAFFIIDGCSASQCRAAGMYDDNGDNRFEWTADTSGPIWLVAEAIGQRTKKNGFEFDVEIKP